MALAGGCANQALRVAVEEAGRAFGANLLDAGGAFGKVGFRVRLRLGADESQAGDPLRDAAPQLQQHIAADGAAGKYSLRQLEMIEESQNISGKLSHGE